jgi:hypothetical protein
LGYLTFVGFAVVFPSAAVDYALKGEQLVSATAYGSLVRILVPERMVRNRYPATKTYLI